MDHEELWLDAVSAAHAIGISRDRFDALKSLTRPTLKTIGDPLSRNKTRRLYRLSELIRWVDYHLRLSPHQIASLEQVARYVLPGDRHAVAI